MARVLCLVSPPGCAVGVGSFLSQKGRAEVREESQAQLLEDSFLYSGERGLHLPVTPLVDRVST